MRNIFIGALVFTGLIGSVSAQVSNADVSEGFFVKGGQSGLVELIQAHPELTLDHMSSQGFEVFGPKGLEQWLKSINAQYEKLAHNHGIGNAINKRAKLFRDYPSYEQITASLKSLAKSYPNIMSLFSLGKSVEGRELWMVKISDNVGVDELEPEFKYISSMHGDEITGRELTQMWIKDVLEGYGKDERITELVNNTEIYVMPSMNPDGSKRRMRGNGNRVDLNRNFPDWTAREANNSAGRQPETQAIMNFQAERQFSLSANFHGGAVVVNYPWDSTYERHPFDALVKGLSLDYSLLNPEMRSSRYFSDGVTNGADWYKVVGGMQDWSYVWHNDLQVTIELSNQKWPRYSEIPAFYQDNKESMFVFAQRIHQGAGFKIPGFSGEGRVELSVLDGSGRRAKSLGTYGFHGGEFYKVLPIGSYKFEVEAGGRSYEFEASVEADKILANGNYIVL